MMKKDTLQCLFKLIASFHQSTSFGIQKRQTLFQVLESVGIKYLFRLYLCFATGKVCLLTMNAFFRRATFSVVLDFFKREDLVAAINFAHKHRKFNRFLLKSSRRIFEKI